MAEPASQPRREVARAAATALLVCIAYYAGARLGFDLRFPPATPSVLWPPNAILTATLLLAPPRRWWLYLLAALPAHVLIELQAGFPMPLVLALFATNCSEALIAALGVRAFSDAPARLDSLRRVVVFVLAAVLAAPLLSSFLDAAAVAGLRGEPYWAVWQTRFFSNVLTELTLVPALLLTVGAGLGGLRAGSGRRHLEAALLAGGLLGALVLGVAGASGSLGVTVPGSLLAFPLPFLLWAAVRFGPRGASLSLLAAASLAIWAGVHGRGPFTVLPPTERVLAFQVFLTVVAVPFLCLAAVIEERRLAREALEERLAFEELLARLSGALVHVVGEEMAETIDTWLGQLGRRLGLDSITLVRPGGDGAESATTTHAWTAPGATAAPPGGDFPSLPLVAGSRTLGALTFHAPARRPPGADPLVQRLRLVAEVFANALARQEGEEALRISEAMKSAILASLPSHVALLDREGRVIAVNQRAMGAASPGSVALGASYLEVCRQAAEEGSAHAREMAAGVKGVLDGSRAGFTLEYGVSGPAGEQWFAIAVVPLSGPGSGAVVSHTETTERRRAELAAQRSRQELAHFTRVSTMGELAASLAHELSQPLTGILTNAQAGRRFLDATPPDLVELREILTEIIEDDRRAGEVIRRLRELLRKGEARVSRLDLNALIRDVVKLVSSDAVIRNISVRLDLAPEPAWVEGDRVELQQVVLNLLLNALEATGEDGDGDRTVVVWAAGTDVDTVHVRVEDSGSGLPSGTESLVFEPFYTTKPDGMGMGLAIARSIVEAHRGLIWATRNSRRGATFHFALPLAGSRA